MAFLKNILSQFSKLRTAATAPLAPAGPQAHVAAFGKHPGWDDHIDDIGVDTERLVAVKRTLYLQGIGGNLDSGTWERLTESQRLDRFDHLFLWRCGDKGEELVVGRLAASSDGKGRGRYPMVVCAHCQGLTAERVAGEISPHLVNALARCGETRSAPDVIEILQETQQGVDSRLQAAGEAQAGGDAGTSNAAFSDDSRATPSEIPETGETLAAGAAGDKPKPAASAVAELAWAADLGPGGTKLYSVLFQIHREMRLYQPLDGSARSASASTAGVPHLRVPMCATDPAQAVRWWIEFLAMHLAPSAPILAVAAVEQGWVDLLVGEPRAQDVFCLLASREMMPFTTDIPYNMDAAFLARAARTVAEYRAARPLESAPGDAVTESQTAADASA